jgi:hypothetical protein
MKSILLIGLLFFAMTHQAQKSELSFRGELSMHTSYSFDNDLEALSGGRYLPELNWKNSFDSSRFVDFTAGVNLYGSSMFHPLIPSSMRVQYDLIVYGAVSLPSI